MLGKTVKIVGEYNIGKGWIKGTVLAGGCDQIALIKD